MNTTMTGAALVQLQISASMIGEAEAGLAQLPPDGVLTRRLRAALVFAKMKTGAMTWAAGVEILAPMVARLETELHEDEGQLIALQWATGRAFSARTAFGQEVQAEELIRAGDHARGWDLYRHGFDGTPCRASEQERAAVRHLPRWQGEPYRRLVVLLEQGHGDGIMCARWLGRLPGAVSILPNPLAGLLLNSFPWLTCDGGPFDGDGVFWVPSFDLLHLLGVPDAPPLAYLKAKPRNFGPGLHVGLCWHGNKDHPYNGIRSMAPELLEPLRGLPVTFHSLCLEELPWAPVAGRTWGQTAAAVAGMDLVISVDTAVAHLAGALGCPVWLLNRWRGCWRWGDSGERTNWYASMRIFRQGEDCAWGPVVERVLRELSP